MNLIGCGDFLHHSKENEMKNFLHCVWITLISTTNIENLIATFSQASLQSSQSANLQTESILQYVSHSSSTRKENLLRKTL
jgi:hypothetical protein